MDDSLQTYLEVFQLNKFSRKDDFEKCINYLKLIYEKQEFKTISITVKRTKKDGTTDLRKFVDKEDQAELSSGSDEDKKPDK